MSQPRRFTSHDGATATGPGDVTLTNGHLAYTLYTRVTASGVASASELAFACRLEGSITDSDFAPLDYRAPDTDNVFEVLAGDLVESQETDGVYVAHVSSNNLPVEFVRANITQMGSNVESVTTRILLNGWPSRGVRYSQVEERDVSRNYDVADPG